jgi:squalene synthase HpnC
MNLAESAFQSIPSPVWSQQKTYSIPTLDEAFKYCLNLAGQHYENFPVASLALPKSLRPYVAAVYAFARTADDFADEVAYQECRMAKLKEWEGHLKAMQTKAPTHPVFVALKETVSRFQIPLFLFFDLLTAFKLDVITSRYSSFNQLLGYCRYSANPVGRIILTIMGYPVPLFMEYSDAICTALQLANFWQDVEIDLLKNRIYLPQEDLSRFGLSEQALRAKDNSPHFKKLMHFQIERTTEFFERGKPLCTKIPGRFGFELKLTWLGGMSILKKLSAQDGAVFGCRPTLGKKDALILAFKALHKSHFTL